MLKIRMGMAYGDQDCHVYRVRAGRIDPGVNFQRDGVGFLLGKRYFVSAFIEDLGFAISDAIFHHVQIIKKLLVCTVQEMNSARAGWIYWHPPTQRAILPEAKEQRF